MNTTAVDELFQIEQVVQPAQNLAGLQGPHGTLVLREHLGPGVVLETRYVPPPFPLNNKPPEEEILVHWAAADFDAWMQPNEVERLDPYARLIAEYEWDGHEQRMFKNYKVISRAGLTHSWAVERLPDGVVRTVRTDGSAWTFDWYPLYDRVYPIHTLNPNPTTDDDAEALTVAEVALTPTDTL